MALEAALHHSAGPWKKVEMQQNAALWRQNSGTRARGEENDRNRTPRRQITPPSTAELFELSFEKELGGARPDRLYDGSGPQDRDQQRFMEQSIAPVIVAPVLQIAQLLEGPSAVWEPIPVPQMVEKLVDGDEVELSTISARQEDCGSPGCSCTKKTGKTRFEETTNIVSIFLRHERLCTGALSQQ